MRKRDLGFYFDGLDNIMMTVTIPRIFLLNMTIARTMYKIENKSIYIDEWMNGR